MLSLVAIDCRPFTSVGAFSQLAKNGSTGRILQAIKLPARLQSVVWILFVVLLIVAVPAMVRSDDDVGVNSSSEKSGMKLPPRHGGHDTHVATSRTKINSSAGGLWTTVISLAAIVGCLLLVGHWLRPLLGAPRGLSIDALELLGRRAIDPKVSIHLVRCGSRVLVLSVSAEGARTLSEITDDGEVQKLIAACRNPADGREVSANRDSSQPTARSAKASSSVQSEGSRRAS